MESLHFRNQDGFVVPYVLAVILVVSLLTAWGANSLQLSQEAFIRIDQTERQLWAMDVTEEKFLKVYLGATMVSHGIDISGREVDETALALGDPLPEEGLTPEDVWNATRGLKMLEWNGRQIAAFYQDADALLSLNSADLSYVSRWLKSAGYSAPEDMAAKLGDYRDADNIRQFRGAERSEYRLLQKPPPSNSHLRSLSEANQILGWGSFTSKLNIADLLQLTLFFSASTPRLDGAPESLKARLLLPSDARQFLSQDDLNDAELFMSKFPSSRAQLTLVEQAGDRENVWVRIVEIERTGGAPDRAFVRRLIWEGRIKQTLLLEALEIPEWTE